MQELKKLNRIYKEVNKSLISFNDNISKIEYAKIKDEINEQEEYFLLLDEALSMNHFLIEQIGDIMSHFDLSTNYNILDYKKSLRYIEKTIYSD